ncbi:hypothetical protein SAMN04487944_106107 [Gracilibacillus ureilyticus]|uniref:Anti-sigma-K factor rskA n=1 Tax=Gracilibacillus ureilyticus TaxID=531814 RepID=A0A1H9QAP4_9BACI|nr:anti-sigma factor [Gracilibacillus ureilyticus]SER57591.1 hypothetical protein SAMN04487944_106107 [Gracilibacillus ureilyticus]
MNKKHVREEEIIDFLNGDTEESENFKIEEHISECEQCKQLYLFWQEALPTGNETIPSPFLKIRVDKRLKRGWLQKRQIQKPFAVAAGMMIIMIVCLSLPDLLRQSVTTEPKYEIFQNSEIKDQEIFVSNPQVEKQEIVPIANNEVNGEVWVNNETSEILLELYGLSGLDQNDHQLWIVDHQNRAKGEILMVENGTTRVLYRLDDLSHYKFLKGSLEPLGGSHQPTGPETFFVTFE